MQNTPPYPLQLTGELSPRLSRGRLSTSGVEPKRRVRVGHETCVGDDSEDPAVQAEDEVVERTGVAIREEQGKPGKEHEQPNQATAGGVEPAVAVI